eukprot:COSAG06_NODE_19678_length_827_cov_1.157967_2_plen_191_part_01
MCEPPELGAGACSALYGDYYGDYYTATTARRLRRLTLISLRVDLGGPVFLGTHSGQRGAPCARVKRASVAFARRAGELDDPALPLAAISLPPLALLSDLSVVYSCRAHVRARALAELHGRRRGGGPRRRSGRVPGPRPAPVRFYHQIITYSTLPSSRIKLIVNEAQQQLSSRADCPQSGVSSDSPPPPPAS